MKYVIASTLMMLATSVAAQEGRSTVPVYVSAQCDQDIVGKRVAFKVKEGLRRSASMSLADRYPDSVITLSIVCQDPDANLNGVISRYAIQVTLLNPKGFYDYALTHGVNTCGANRVDSCADSLVADIDDAIGKLRERIADGSFKLSE